MVFKIEKDTERLGDSMVVDDERGIALKIKDSGSSAVKTFLLEWRNGKCLVEAEALNFPEETSGTRVEWNIHKMIYSEGLDDKQKEAAKAYLCEALDFFGLTGNPRYSGHVTVYFENFPHKGRGYDV